jgi:hypothetical protein
MNVWTQAAKRAFTSVYFYGAKVLCAKDYARACFDFEIQRF